MKKTVLFQGDSITDCGRSSCGGAGYCCGEMGPGYPGLIAGRLACDIPETEWTFYNRGISGNRVVDLYARWKCDGINLAPDILSILIGVNDTWHGLAWNNGVEPERYERIYREILTWTREKLPNVQFVLMEPFILNIGAVAETPGDWFSDIAARQDAVRRLAGEFDAVFLPLQKLFDDAVLKAAPGHWLADGVHPTPAGHQLIADAWIAAAGKLLER